MCAHRNGREFGRAVRKFLDTPVGEPCQPAVGHQKQKRRMSMLPAVRPGEK
jgi:hypothetical protein